MTVPKRKDDPRWRAVDQYLAGLLALTVGSTVVASAATLRGLRRPAIEELRDL